jgi:hypothetical protein
VLRDSLPLHGLLLGSHCQICINRSPPPALWWNAAEAAFSVSCSAFMPSR